MFSGGGMPTMSPQQGGGPQFGGGGAAPMQLPPSFGNMPNFNMGGNMPLSQITPQMLQQMLARGPLA
jgi:hypothetical protein